MHTKYNKFLIIILFVIIFSGIYTYVSNNLEVAKSTQTSSALSASSLEGMPAIDPSLGDKISQDTAFLSTLVSLTKIQINTSIFSDQGFKILKDNTVLIEPVVLGRPNPFAPVLNETTIDTASVSPVVTNEPTEITDKSALLNGQVETVSNGIVTYFDYGPTPTFGKSTPAAKQSLIGSFVTSITGLKSKTAYFYRAVAKINGTLQYGEIVSFTTN